ncbi:MAG: MBL fold metallo-hydrolase, partial [Bacteroidaceae bacterium]|nr:MBL fold metallo-hydrolase [Bacteroidaceae bacterium]
MKRKVMIILGIIVLLIVGLAVLLQHPAFGRYPQGERLARIQQSPNYRDGQFQNLHPTPTMTARKRQDDAGSSWWDFFTSKESDRVPSEPVPAVKTDLRALDLTRNALVWFGHSSYLLVNGGKTFLVDPVLTTSFPASLMMKPFKGTDIYSPEDIPAVDFLIITHDHYDHLDYRTVTAIQNRVQRVVCPLGIGEHLEYWGYPSGRITEMDWNETISLDGVAITCLPARHFSGRFLRSNNTLWASFMIQGEKCVYVGGDGGYDTHFEEIGRQFPHIDLALLENGQYNEDWPYIHTLPGQLPMEIKALDAK